MLTTESGDLREDAVDVLLVEDNPGDVRLTRDALNGGPIETTVHVVSDGIEALDFLRQRADYVDAPEPAIVLLDLNLPRKDGEEVLEAVKGDESLRHIPVVVLTSSKSHEDVLKSYDLSANAYLTKPIDPSEYMEIIRAFERMWLSVVRLPKDEG